MERHTEHEHRAADIAAANRLLRERQAMSFVELRMRNQFQAEFQHHQQAKLEPQSKLQHQQVNQMRRTRQAEESTHATRDGLSQMRQERSDRIFDLSGHLARRCTLNRRATLLAREMVLDLQDRQVCLVIANHQTQDPDLRQDSDFMHRQSLPFRHYCRQRGEKTRMQVLRENQEMLPFHRETSPGSHMRGFRKILVSPIHLPHFIKIGKGLE